MFNFGARRATIIFILVATARVAYGQLSGIDAPRALENSLRGQFSQIDSVHLRARTIVTFVLADGTSAGGEATLEYWATDDKYRIESVVSPALVTLGLQPSRTITFDGYQGRLLLSEGSTLIVQSDPAADSSAVPNPLFGYLGFLGFRSSVCSECRPGLTDIRGKAHWLDRPERVWLSRGSSSNGRSEITIAEDRSEAKLEISEVEGSPFVTAIKKRSSAGALVESAEFLEPMAMAQTRPAMVVPRRTVLEKHDGQGELPGDARSAKIETIIELIELNAEIEADRFTIPEAIASTVIDEDLKTVERAPRCRPSRPGGM